MIAEKRIEHKMFVTFDSETLRKQISNANIGKMVAPNYCQQIAELVTGTMEKDGKAMKQNQFVEELRKQVKDRQIPFVFSDDVYKQIHSIALNTSYEIGIHELNDGSDEIIDLYNNGFIQAIPEKIRPVFERAIPDGKRSVAFTFHHAEEDGRKLGVVVVDFGDYIWTPIVPTDILFEKSNVQIDFYLIIDRLEKALETYFDKKVVDKGMVRVIGPKGGEFLCGEVTSSVERTKIKEKIIDLDNGYKMNIFI